jgi:hypothetical protein
MIKNGQKLRIEILPQWFDVGGKQAYENVLNTHTYQYIFQQWDTTTQFREWLKCDLTKCSQRYKLSEILIHCY